MEIQITNQLLIDNGFTNDTHNIENMYVYYRKTVSNLGSVQFVCYINEEENLNNSGRKWDCHIDNEDFCSIGWAEIDTIEQFKSLCDCVGFDSKLFIAEE